MEEWLVFTDCAERDVHIQYRVRQTPRIIVNSTTPHLEDTYVNEKNEGREALSHFGSPQGIKAFRSLAKRGTC